MGKLASRMTTTNSARHPNTGVGYDTPIHLCRLEIGDRFIEYDDAGLPWGLPDKVRTGTVLWVGFGSVEIWWDDEPKATRCQPELPVYRLDEEPLGETLTEQYYAEAVRLGGQMTSEVNPTQAAQGQSTPAPINPTIKALLARYQFQLKTLTESLEGDDKAKASICMARLQKAVAEARQLHIPLPSVPAALAEYAPLVELLSDDADKRKTDALEAEQRKAVQEVSSTKAANRAVAMERHQTEVGAAKAAKVAKPKAEKKLRPCLDGCGTMVPGNFQMGHDAKLKSLLIKIERGEQPLDAVPEVAMDLVKIVKGEAIQDRDSEGKPKGEPKQTYRITAAPVRFPGRDDIQLTKRDD